MMTTHTIPYFAGLGTPHPRNDLHAISVSIPTWKATCDYEEGKAVCTNNLKTGYPRFIIHYTIDRFSSSILQKHGEPGQNAMLFPSIVCAQQCLEYLLVRFPVESPNLFVLGLGPTSTDNHDSHVLPYIVALVYPSRLWPTLKYFWQHTGAGISTRMSDFCEKAFVAGALELKSKSTVSVDGTMTKTNIDGATERPNSYEFTLDKADSEKAKAIIRKRIAGAMSSSLDLNDAVSHPEQTEIVHHDDGFSTDDVYLYPSGMNAIFEVHQNLLRTRGQKKVIVFGFPYADTLSVANKWGPGCLFYGHGSEEDLDDLENRLVRGEQYLALFCEFPGNPLLHTPNLKRIRQIADKHDFPVVVDETIGNFLNVHVLPDADIVLTSLTKIFSGSCNVMAGSIVLNPARKHHYCLFKDILSRHYEDNLFSEDAICLEKNSRDFVLRTTKVNASSEAIVSLLHSHPKVKKVHYPQISPSRANYDAYRLPHGGYGGLLSCTFHTVEDAAVFFDSLEVAKGPSLGTNFTLATPHVLTVYYDKLDWAAQYGCEASLVRMAVGMEDVEELKRLVKKALDAIPA